MRFAENSQKKFRILFLVTEDWFFCSHRLPVARAARDAGLEVYVMTKVNNLGASIEVENFKLVPWRSISRGSLNPFRELISFLEVILAYRKIHPDLVHHVAIKPVVYGGLVTRFFHPVPTVSAITGLGHVFTSNSWKMRSLRYVLNFILKRILCAGESMTVFQNADDREAFIRAGVLDRGKTALVRGSGVDVERFVPTPEPEGTPVVTLPCRMLWKKGVGDFVEVATRMKQRGVRARFVLVGDTDTENPSGIRRDQLQAWANSGIVEWWGFRDDMPAVFAESSVVCFPTTYGEGVPRVLIEAGAAGRPTIATNVPGCREVIRSGENGILVPPGDVAALTDAVNRLTENSTLRAEMGIRARKIVLGEFTEVIVTQQTLAVYDKLLGSNWGAGLASSALIPPVGGGGDIVNPCAE